MESIRSYLKTLSPEAQSSFAERCGTTLGYLRKALSREQQLGEKLVIALERESGGAIRVESVRPDVDWGYIRGSARTHTKRKCVGG